MKKSEYLKILNPIIEEYEKYSYSFWKERIDQVISLEGKTESDEEYQIEIEAIWDDKPNELIRVCFSIDNGGWRAYFPVSESLLIKSNKV